MNQLSTCDSEPVSAITTVARHDVAPGNEQKFVDWARRVDLASRDFDGYLGMELIRSHGESDSTFFCIFRFDSADNTDTWMNSDTRRRQLADECSFYDAPTDVQSYRSLEYWFASPKSPGAIPSDNKMALVTLLVIWPLVHFIAPLVGSFIHIDWIAEFVTIGAIVGLMTYIVMPAVVRVLGDWLFR